MTSTFAEHFRCTSEYLPIANDSGLRHVIKFVLASHVADDGGERFGAQIGQHVKGLDVDLFVIDVTQGEPLWLNLTLNDYSSFGLPLHIVGRVTNATRKAWHRARSSNSLILAKSLGFPVDPDDDGQYGIHVQD